MYVSQFSEKLGGGSSIVFNFQILPLHMWAFTISEGDQSTATKFQGETEKKPTRDDNL